MNKLRNSAGTFARRKAGEFFEGFPVYLSQKGYKLIWLNGRDVKIHVLVWERENGPKPKGFELHHKDYDKGNYSLQNLELLSHSDHQRLHAGWAMKSGEWVQKPCTECKKVLPLDSFYPRKGHTPSAKCKPCHCKQTAKWSKANPEKRKKIGLDYYYRQKGERPHA